ncbi:MAG TPA: hypothetical protein VGS08_02480 [Candidatus Saccharimonadales bacterium]|nr:hypothetical protein [Candidatus Saccharimonadales bacterium]
MKTFGNQKAAVGRTSKQRTLDVVCSMEIDPSATHYTVRYHGTIIFAQHSAASTLKMLPRGTWDKKGNYYESQQ